jgi:hypothetical protein
LILQLLKGNFPDGWLYLTILCGWNNTLGYTDKKEKKIVLIYKEIHSGAVAKSYMTNGLLSPHIWGKYLRISSYIRKPFLIYIYDFATAPV